jgi:hypothetical protein
MNRFRVLAFAALVLTFATPSPAPAPCCCGPQHLPTFRKELGFSKFVLYGRFTNPQKFTGAVESPTTEFIVEKVLKGDPLPFKSITLNRYISLPNPKNPSKFIIFADVFKGQLDPYRGIEVNKGSKLVRYLQGAAAMENSPVGERMRYYFKHLNNPESVIAADAFREFEITDYKDYSDMAKKLPAERLVKWLQDPKTSLERLGLYATLLGQCGKDEHGRLLRKMIDDPKYYKSDLGGMLVGYANLQPKEGWKHITDLLKDQKQDFVRAYAALRATDTLWKKPPSHLTRKDLVDGVALFLDYGDVADLAIERLRLWQRWEMTDRVLDQFGKKTHDNATIKRGILRFALQSPTQRAFAFVHAQRSLDPQLVEDMEEWLKLE